MTYEVKAGVDLWLLAGWFYGNPHLWDIIYYENIDIIGDDPDDLSVGMVINIPRIESKTEGFIVSPEAA